VPFGDAGLWIAGVLTTFWVALGSWVAVFPGTLEKLLGIDYDFEGSWGVSRGTYEALTLGTLAVILAFAVIGYALSRSVREQVAVLPLETDPAAPAPAL
jgi:hypothetical protein